MDPAPAFAPCVSVGLLQNRKASPHPRKRPFAGALMPHGAPTRIPANFGILTFPPFYLLLFAGWFSLGSYICIKLQM